MRLDNLGLRGRLVALVLSITSAACMTDAQRRAAEDERAAKEVAQEIKRICNLPSAERNAELERVKKEFGVILYCGDTDKDREK